MNKKYLAFARLAACALFVFFAVNQTFAQADDDTPTHEFTIWGGFSPDSSTVIKGTGRTEDARFGIIAGRYARRFNNNDTINLKYTIDAIPAAVLNYPDFEPVIVPAVIGIPIPPPIRVRRTAYAFGVSPLGLQINFRPRKKYQPFVEGTGGLLYFNKRIPQFTGSRFAFTADVGGGVEIMLKNKRSVTVGYKFFHVSNGNRGLENPGFDNNLFYVGYSFLK